MGISQIGVSSSTSGSVVATATSPNVLYRTSVSLSAGIYSVTCVSTTIAKVTFYNGTTPLTTATTVTGSTTINLGQSATSILYWVDTGTDINISMTLTGTPLASGVSGTLDTITASGTYTGTGYGFALVVSGGQRGYSGWTYSGYAAGGAGGSSGGVVGPFAVTLTGSMSVTVGAAGIGSDGALGGSSTFAGQTATCGGTGSGAGGPGNNQGTRPGSASSNGVPVINGTTGGGGGGLGSLNGNAGAGGGNGVIGTGGNGGSNTAGYNGSGYGAGGGGGGAGPGYGPGGATQGVVYVIRFT